MAHVGVERLSAGGGEEDAAQDHEARLVVGAQQHLHGIEGVEGPQHGGQRPDVQQPRNAEEGEPQQHHRAEGLADAAGAGVLDGKEHRNNEKRDDDDLGLPRAEEAVHHCHASQALHRGGHGDGGGQHPVGQQGRAAQHGGQDQPFAAVFHQRVEGENAALAVVVGLHGDQHVLDRGQQRDRPDHQRQGADDEALVDMFNAAVALQDGFHDVHRGGADVAVHNSDGHQEETKTEFFLVVHTFTLFLQKRKILNTFLTRWQGVLNDILTPCVNYNILPHLIEKRKKKPDCGARSSVSTARLAGFIRFSVLSLPGARDQQHQDRIDLQPSQEHGQGQQEFRTRGEKGEAARGADELRHARPDV